MEKLYKLIQSPVMADVLVAINILKVKLTPEETHKYFKGLQIRAWDSIIYGFYIEKILYYIAGNVIYKLDNLEPCYLRNITII